MHVKSAVLLGSTLTASLKLCCRSSSAKMWKLSGLLLRRTADFNMVRVSSSRGPQATTARWLPPSLHPPSAAPDLALGSKKKTN